MSFMHYNLSFVCLLCFSKATDQESTPLRKDRRDDSISTASNAEHEECHQQVSSPAASNSATNIAQQSVQVT